MGNGLSLKCTMILGDCLDVMPTLPKASAQMIFADLPYAVEKKRNNALRWDHPVDLKSMWVCLLEKSGASCAYVFTANLPLSATLYYSNPKLFRHDIVYTKQIRTGFLSADRAPLRAHELVLVFAAGTMTYNPQMLPLKRKRTDNYGTTAPGCYNLGKHESPSAPSAEAFPQSIIAPRWENSRFTGSKRCLHPTQKPVALLDWLIRTYSNPRDTILDPVSGSGTTAVSSINNGRHVTCIEKDPGYFEASLERIRKHVTDNAIDAEIEVRQ